MPRKEGQKRKLLVLLDILARETDEKHPLSVPQLVERLQSRIVAGEYPPGAKIDSVRDLASEAAVNPNTMQRALAELKARGLLETQRTAGRTVTSDTEKLAQARQSLARKLVHDFYRQASALGLTKAELAALLEQEEG